MHIEREAILRIRRKQTPPLPPRREAVAGHEDVDAAADALAAALRLVLLRDRVDVGDRALQLVGGRLCIRPAQLAAVRAGFAPTAEEVAWARRIAGAGDSVVRVGEEMVDRPVLERARAILRRAPSS